MMDNLSRFIDECTVTDKTFKYRMYDICDANDPTGLKSKHPIFRERPDDAVVLHRIAEAMRCGPLVYEEALGIMCHLRRDAGLGLQTLMHIASVAADWWPKYENMRQLRCIGKYLAVDRGRYQAPECAPCPVQLAKYRSAFIAMFIFITQLYIYIYIKLTDRVRLTK
jgi:hypothetical protein